MHTWVYTACVNTGVRRPEASLRCHSLGTFHLFLKDFIFKLCICIQGPVEAQKRVLNSHPAWLLGTELESCSRVTDQLSGLPPCVLRQGF